VINVIKFHTGCGDFAVNVDAVDDGAVPTTMSKLVLTLVDRHLSAVLHSDYVLDVAPTNAPLTPRQPHQAAAFSVRQGSDVAWRYGVGR